jgi:hypothetical protein
MGKKLNSYEVFLPQTNENHKQQKDTRILGGVHYLDGGYGIMDTLSPKSSKYTH